MWTKENMKENFYKQQQRTYGANSINHFCLSVFFFVTGFGLSFTDALIMLWKVSDAFLSDFFFDFAIEQI